MIANRLLLVAGALTALAAPADAQSIASRVREINNGTLRLSYPVEPGVCGYGANNFSWRDNRVSVGNFTSTDRKRGESEYECTSGPARVALDVERGRVVDMRFYVGGRWANSSGEDMGQVSAVTAVEFFQSVFESESPVAEKAIVPAIIADGGDPYPALLRVAKDRDRTRKLRESAIFWLGQEAGEVATRGLKAIVISDDDREVRKSAIFALSQQRNEVATDALIDIVRNNRDPEMKKTALFWLGQSKDPKAFSLIEEILNKR